MFPCFRLGRATRLVEARDRARIRAIIVSMTSPLHARTQPEAEGGSHEMTTYRGSGVPMTNRRKDAGLRARVLCLARRLAPLLKKDLAPDAAGPTALLWASLLVEAEERDLQGRDTQTVRRSRRSRTDRALSTLPVLAREHAGIPAPEVIARFLERLRPTSWMNGGKRV